MTTYSLKGYWNQVRERIELRLIQRGHHLESLQVRQRRFNLSNRGLGCRVKDGCLTYHRYNQYVESDETVTYQTIDFPD